MHLLCNGLWVLAFSADTCILLPYFQVLNTTMKATSFASIRPLQNTQFWLLVLAGGLIVVQLSWELPQTWVTCIIVLGWGTVLSFAMGKASQLTLESDVFSSLLGVLLILCSSGAGSWSVLTLFDISPFIAALGLAMLASGVKGLHYWTDDCLGN